MMSVNTFHIKFQNLNIVSHWIIATRSHNFRAIMLLDQLPNLRDRLSAA